MRERGVEKIFSEAADLGLDCIDRFPKRSAHLVGTLLADVCLKEHLHREFAGFATSAGGQASPPSTSLRRRLTISMAAMAASNPLFPALMPARFSACSRVSQVSTPKLCGTPV